MNKTISINLGGMFFHIDEDAYQKLSRYFDAVKRSLSPDGREEIMKDIESRIAELFQERIQNEKQVVSLVEIDAVIGIMGQPEDYKIDEEAAQSIDYNILSKAKKLYRDKENSIIGGVASGFGHYLNIDPVWIRLLFVIIVVASFGSPILIYLILLVIIPVAKTTSQKLEMKGEPITISNIERKVKEGIDDIAEKFNKIDSQKFTENTRQGIHKTSTSIGKLFTTLFGLFTKIIGGIIVLFSSIALIGFCVASVFMIFSANMPDNFILNHIKTPIGLETLIWIQGILMLLVFGIPFFFILLLGLKLLVNHMKSIGAIAKYTLLATWIIAFGIAISLGINEASQLAYEGKSVQKQELIINPTDTLLIKFKNNDFYSKNVFHETDFRITQDEKNKEIIYSNNVSIEIMETESPIAYLQVEKLAKGKSADDARKRAEKIKYGFKIDGNVLQLDNYLIAAVEDQFRGQEIALYLYLPKGTHFKTDKNFYSYDISNDDFFNLHFSSSDYIYRVDLEKVKCLNCPISENQHQDVETNEVENDSTATIIYNENGVLVKKKINETLVIEDAKKKTEIKTKK
ncbi:PspC domain-containing protein [Flavobacterium sp.]|jgi:phage shock protein PspC (stress-responsive transcriptional regulator)|uniref:PspC domain-containing protein n=1 Tax=Flavobacterium sp. TaxID=239 RepID=UPI0037C1715E